MHRFFGHTCGKVSQCFPVSQIYLKQNSQQACHFCNERHSKFLISVQTMNWVSFSTHANSDILILNNVKKPKNSRKSRQKYTELFEVSDNASNLKQILIKNLNANNIDILTQNLESTPEGVHLLDKKDRFQESMLNFNYQDEVDEDSMLRQAKLLGIDEASMDCEEILEDPKRLLEILEDSDVEEQSVQDFSKSDEKTPSVQSTSTQNTPRSQSEGKSRNRISKSDSKDSNSSSSSKSSSKEKNGEKSALELQLESIKRMAKEADFNHSLLSFVEVCVSLQFLNRAYYTVLKYHQSYKSNLKSGAQAQKVKVSHPKIFSTLAHGFASKRNLPKINELMRMFMETGITPTPQLFAACLECIGRLPRSEELDSELAHIMKLMEQEGISINQLFTEATYVNDQRQKVLEAVQIFKPDFKVQLSPLVLDYSCPLLNHLNCESTGRSFRSPVENLFSPESLMQLAANQLKIEKNVAVTIKSIEKVQRTSDIVNSRKKLNELKTQWRASIKDGLSREISLLQLKNHKFNEIYSMNLYPFLRALSVETYAEIIMQEIEKLMEGSETFSGNLNYLCSLLGQRVQTRYLIQNKYKTNVSTKQFSLYKTYCRWYLNPDSSSSNTRQKWMQLVRKSALKGPDLHAAERPWSPSFLYGIGRILYNVITKDVKINVNTFNHPSNALQMEPAFYTLFRTHGFKTSIEIKPHPILTRLNRTACSENLRFDATLVPMVSPPLPWSTIYSGGYILAKTDLIRLDHVLNSQWQKLEQTPTQHMYPSLDALNQLSSVPWIINKPVLDIIVHLFNNGGSEKLDIPMPPSACPEPEALPPNPTKQQRFLAVKEKFMLSRKKKEMHSLRCDALYRLSLANHYRDKIFWLPHNMDFRGRVYPVAPLLNHLGSDMARSMLFFAKGEPLGPKGLDWLKIHCINLTGLKKRDCIQDRLDYANEILDDILDSANNPLNGKMWWSESENPWQTLSCCMTIRDAIKSGAPESFICHFPVHQDGSCNGLQHYAALGRDLAGAISVNLTPADAPQDVYSSVAALVEEERIKDAKNGVETAITLEGFVKRKVIKQTVMTTVYGVTRFGARLQIVKQLKDMDDFPSAAVWAASHYLVSKTFFSLQEMFTSTKKIQDWFTECARMISQMTGQPVEWVTPLGLPIVQPYMRTKSVSTTSLSTKTNQLSVITNFQTPNVMRQKNAFPPNFIHSLDSCHMMLTALHCERRHISFVSVHDCFWTHPSTVGIMNKECRDQFVNLHSLPILEDLSAYLIDRFGFESLNAAQFTDKKTLDKINFNLLLQKVPSKGELDIQKVKESVYFFS